MGKDSPMDRVDDYRGLARSIVERLATAEILDNDAMELLAICDDASGNYLHMTTSWQNGYRAYYPIVHLRIKGGKIWISRMEPRKASPMS